jgi:flagellar biosynthesis chaperone FliJ
VENKISVIESSITNLAKTSQEIQRISEQTKNWMYAAWEQNTDVGIDSCNSHSHPLLRIADTVDTLVQNYAILSNMIKDMNSNSHTYNNELANKFTTISRNAIKSLTEHFDTALSANKLALEQFHIKDSEVRNLVFQTMQQGLDGQATAIIELNKYTMDLPVNIGILLDESSQNLNSELAAKFESLINFNKNLVEELFTLEQRARQKFLDMMHSELVAFQSIIEKLPTAVVDSLRNSLGHVEEMREREIAKLGEILLRQKSELDQLPDKIANGLQPVRELREREISQLEQILAKQKMDLERANKDLEQLWSNLIKKVNKK